MHAVSGRSSHAPRPSSLAKQSHMPHPSQSSPHASSLAKQQLSLRSSQARADPSPGWIATLPALRLSRDTGPARCRVPWRLSVALAREPHGRAPTFHGHTTSTWTWPSSLRAAPCANGCLNGCLARACHWPGGCSPSFRVHHLRRRVFPTPLGHQSMERLAAQPRLRFLEACPLRSSATLTAASQFERLSAHNSPRRRVLRASAPCFQKTTPFTLIFRPGCLPACLPARCPPARPSRRPSSSRAHVVHRGQFGAARCGGLSFTLHWRPWDAPAYTVCTYSIASANLRRHV